MKTFDEVLAMSPGEGWLHEGEARLLWRCCERMAGPILEVGCYVGRSTCFLGAFGREVYCVDPFAGFNEDDPSGDGVERRFLENMARCGVDNFMLFRQRVEDWEPLPVGFAYLDGDHTFEGTQRQAQIALRCGAKVIAVHDVNDHGGGIMVREGAVGVLGPWHERVERLAVWNIK